MLVACGGGGSSDPVDAPGGGGADADPNAPDADPSGFETLISSSWTLGPGDETYICATRTMTEDVYAHVLRPIAPVGTHHTVIAIGSPTGPDNPSFPCGPEFGAFWASGVNSPTLTLPDGVGLVAESGQQLRLSLHLFNTSDTAISGTSGLEIQRIAAADVEHVASVGYHGPAAFAIPPNNQPYSATDTTAIGDRTIVAIFPHMHQLGEHFRARIVGGTETTLWDDDYQFDSQEVAPIDSVHISAGQELETTCTWRNDTDNTVTWGDSSTAEMCFTILMTY